MSRAPLNGTAAAVTTAAPAITRHVAVMGTGSIGMRHVRVLSSLEGVRALAVPVRPSRAAELRAQGVEAVDGLDAARREGATACIIASDTGLHAEHARLAMAQGLDVLVEKPLAVDAAAARALADDAARLGRRVAVGCVLRFSASLQAFRERVSLVGPLHRVHIVCESYLPDWRPDRPYQTAYCARPEEGGVLLDLIHEIDYAGWLFGWPSEVFGSVRNLRRLGIDADELVEATWDLPTGGVLTLSMDYLTRPTRRGIVAAGQLGTLAWDATVNAVSLSLAGKPMRAERFDQPRDAMFAAQARAFLDGDDRILANGADAVRALEVCDAVRRSSATRRVVPIPT